MRLPCLKAFSYRNLIVNYENPRLAITLIFRTVPQLHPGSEVVAKQQSEIGTLNQVGSPFKGSCL